MVSRAAYLLMAFSLVLDAQPPRDLKFVSIEVERKYALVIGNASYVAARLRNPVHDAEAVFGVLRRLGFEATLARDLTRRQMDATIDRFTESLQPGDLAIVYYAGHGIQVGQENFLIPVDFAATSEADVRYEAYSASRLRDKLEEKRARLRIIILDACRNNPFRSSRAGTRGLAAMDAAEGTYIAFATRDNGIADDNPKESNGLFTKYLIAALEIPGLHLKEIFEKVKEDVYLASNRSQQPYTYDGIVGRFYFSAPSPAAGSELVLRTELSYWNSIDKRDPRLLEDYLKRYPNGQFAEIARRSLVNSLKIPGRSDVTVPAAGSSSSSPSPGDIRINPKDGQKYVRIPKGSFQMGCSEGDSLCGDNEKPSHRIDITQDFWMGQTEVTQEAFSNVMGRVVSHFQGNQLPAESVTWEEAVAYCKKVEGRLPTEAEWEFAARAGSGSERNGELGLVAWYGGNSGAKTHEVAQKKPNSWGLYDMLGNVWEWTTDWYLEAYYRDSPQSDPQGPSNGEQRVLRGGAWDYMYGRFFRVSARNKDDPKARYVNIGFRCVVQLQ